MTESLSLDVLCERGLISMNEDGSISTGDLQEKIKEGLFRVEPSLGGYKVYINKRPKLEEEKKYALFILNNEDPGSNWTFKVNMKEIEDEFKLIEEQSKISYSERKEVDAEGNDIFNVLLKLHQKEAKQYEWGAFDMSDVVRLFHVAMWD